METNILVAIIAAVTTTIASIATVVVNLLLTRKTLSAQKEVEVFRQLTARWQILLDMTNRHVDTITRSTDSACSQIQGVRDAVRAGIVQNLPVTRASISKIEQNAQLLVKCYQEHHPQFAVEERVLVHEAKNIALSISNSVASLEIETKPGLVSSIYDRLTQLETIQKRLLALKSNHIRDLVDYVSPLERENKALQFVHNLLRSGANSG